MPTPASGNAQRAERRPAALELDVGEIAIQQDRLVRPPGGADRVDSLSSGSLVRPAAGLLTEVAASGASG